MLDPYNKTTAYTYDGLDRVTAVNDPRSLNTQYSYDGFDDLTQLISPDTGQTAYTYDLDGDRLTQTDARHITTQYTYDALDRLTAISYPTRTLNVAFTYDQGTYGIGRLTQIQDAAGTTNYTYNARGDLTQKSDTIGSSGGHPHTFTVSYGYDTADNLTSITYPDGTVVNYTRDSDERITSVTRGSSTVVSGITYKPFGPVTGLTYGNGLVETRGYDQDYRLTSITVPNILSWTLGYNPDDDITGLTDNLVGSNSQTLGYDNLNRLNTGSGAYGSLSYGYDANGNRNTETLNGTNTTFNIASSSNQLVSLSGGININYSYDANGNMTGDGTNTYTYGNTNRLASVTTGSGPDTYQYNALGQRVEKTVGGVTTLFVYDEVGHLLGEYTPAGTLVAEHIWLNNRPIGVITPSGLYYVQTDQLDTPRDITNASKKVVWQWRADPFGNGAPTGSLTYNLRFPGQYYDAETGHNYNYFRDYDPTTGRYIESDPMGLHSSLNTYAYASGNPVSMYDPLGLCKIILRFKPIPWIGQKFHIYHSYILTIQPNGSADFYRGGPVGVPNWESAWGNITTKYGSYGQNTPDWDPTNPPQEVIYSDDKPCNCFNKDLGDIIEKINASDTPYKPLGDNSNSVAGTALRDLGFKIGTPPVLVPGFDYQITIPGH